MREGVKALVLMNGGGAVALLAFLQAIWQKDQVLSGWIVGGLAFLVVGVGSAGLVHLFRVHTSNAMQEAFVLARAEKSTDEPATRMRRFQRAYFICAYVSLGCFLVGVGLVVYGAATSPVSTGPSPLPPF
jgi:hypothetical protein